MLVFRRVDTDKVLLRLGPLIKCIMYVQLPCLRISFWEVISALHSITSYENGLFEFILDPSFIAAYNPFISRALIVIKTFPRILLLGASTISQEIIGLDLYRFLS